MHSEIIVWGTYDLGKPRVRILLKALRKAGIRITDIHGDVWTGIEDKSQLRGFVRKARLVLTWISRYPALVSRFLAAPKHEVVLVPYMGHFDVLILWPFARLRGTRIVWDVFISLYNTVVEDRRMVSKYNPVAWSIYAFEWLATRAADRIVLDTSAHAAYFSALHGIPEQKLTAVFVGAEEEKFPLSPPLSSKAGSESLTVLFYGQFIPLHGTETIIEAARLLDDGSINWVLIGRGQDEAHVRAMLDEKPVRHLTWIHWVPYEELNEWITRADICLGVFGESAKASLVIPNKVFQVVLAGRPLITRDSPAVRELLDETEAGIYLVPPDDAKALADAIVAFRNSREQFVGKVLYDKLRPRVDTLSIGTQFREQVLM